MGDLTQSVEVPLFMPKTGGNELKGQFVEQSAHVSIPAEAYHQSKDSERTQWQLIKGIGTNNTIVTAGPVTARRFADDWGVKEDNPWLEYRFYTFNRGWVNVKSTTLAHPPEQCRARLRLCTSSQ